MITALISLIASILSFLAAIPLIRDVYEALIAGRIAPLRREDIRKFRACYILPDCQETDPAYTEGKMPKSKRSDLFKTIEGMLDDPDKYKYILLLGDSGTGKTAFLVNFFVHRLKFRHWLKYEVRVIPLNSVDPNGAIRQIKQPNRTVLFLDALDEDRRIWDRFSPDKMVAPGALPEEPRMNRQRHQERVQELCDLTGEFRNVLISCRTQFFPRAEEEPEKTGQMKFGPVGGIGATKAYYFHKRYMSLFSDEQVEKFLNCKFSDKGKRSQESARERAWKIVRKIPDLTCRPLILSYIEDLIYEDPRDYTSTHQLYEQIVDSWLKREIGPAGIESEDELLAFSEQLAIEIYSKEQEREGEGGFAFEAINELAREFHIEMDSWKLTSRSLLNRDAGDRFKFAHRSIMEYLYVKTWLKKLSPKERPWITWTTQMKVFLKGMLQESYATSRPSVIPFQLPSGKLPSLNQLRLENKRFICMSNKLGEEELSALFTDTAEETEKVHVIPWSSDDEIVYDINTGLMWQRSGSDYINYKEAQEYIKQLNNKKFAGYTDWRLSTTEETLTLMEPQENKDGLFIHPLFDEAQSWVWTADMRIASAAGALLAIARSVRGVWTADRRRASTAWYVSFSNGSCYRHRFEVSSSAVRAVRSGQSS